MKMKSGGRAAAILLMAVVLFCGPLCLSGCASNKPDFMISFVVTKQYPEEFTEIIHDHLEQYVEDTNGDGKVYIRYAVYYPGNPTRFMSEFGYADSMIFITDAAPLEQFSDKFADILTPIGENGETALPWDSVPGLTALDWTEHPINVQGVDVETETLQEWTSAMQISLRTIEGTDFVKDKQKAAEHACAEALMEALQAE